MKIKKERDTIPREMPGFPGVPEKPDPHPDTVTKTCTIEVITPLFGGGYEAGKVDPKMPIRASSIRGHLRFWWRATRGAKYDTVEKLRQREGEIWGSTENPSPVIVEVQQLSCDSLEVRSHPDFGFARYGPESYAIFSAKENDLCKEGFSFTLSIRWLNHNKLQDLRDRENAELKRLKKKLKPETIDDISPDIEAALKAWVNFGGIGARTRRGCGALFCEELAPNSVEELKQYPFRIFHSKNHSGFIPLKTWAQSVDILKQFRQLRRPPHDKQQHTRNGIQTRRVPGRSYWPEPDSIRQITGCALKPPNLNSFDHSTPLTKTIFFPRAELGLPIVFHFVDGPNNRRPSSKLDPPDVMLIPTTSEGKNGTRMASPVITRPIKLKNGETHPMILVLNKPSLPKLRLLGEDKTVLYDIQQHQINHRSLVDYHGSPLGPKSNPRSSNGSALDAFISFVTNEKGFSEVKP